MIIESSLTEKQTHEYHVPSVMLYQLQQAIHVGSESVCAYLVEGSLY